MLSNESVGGDATGTNQNTHNNKINDMRDVYGSPSISATPGTGPGPNVSGFGVHQSLHFADPDHMNMSPGLFPIT